MKEKATIFDYARMCITENKYCRECPLSELNTNKNLYCKEDRYLYESDIVSAGDGSPEGELLLAIDIAIQELEKQIPKKGIMIGDNYSSVLSCPNCRKPIVNVWNIAKYEPNYCHYCGQALDWR